MTNNIMNNIKYRLAEGIDRIHGDTRIFRKINRDMSDDTIKSIIRKDFYDEDKRLRCITPNLNLWVELMFLRLQYLLIIKI